MRIRELFEHDGRLTSVSNDPKSSMALYARSVDTIVTTVYDVFNRKLFSLPKLLILPGVIGRQPMLLVRIFPFIFATDVVKGRIAATVTDRIEKFKKEAKDVDTRRTKVEQFDTKNAELVSIVCQCNVLYVSYGRGHAVAMWPSSCFSHPSFSTSSLIFRFSTPSHLSASSIGKRCDRVHATAVGRSDVGISIEEGGGRPP